MKPKTSMSKLSDSGCIKIELNKIDSYENFSPGLQPYPGLLDFEPVTLPSTHRRGAEIDDKEIFLNLERHTSGSQEDSSLQED